MSGAKHIPNHAPPLGGTGVVGTAVDCTSANTWYQIPPSGSVPANDYVLSFAPAIAAAGDLKYAFVNTGTPGATIGVPLTGNVAVALVGSEVMYVASTTAGDDVCWSTKEID